MNISVDFKIHGLKHERVHVRRQQRNFCRTLKIFRYVGKGTGQRVPNIGQCLEVLNWKEVKGVQPQGAGWWIVKKEGGIIFYFLGDFKCQNFRE